jgi:hypothetical protein
MTDDRLPTALGIRNEQLFMNAGEGDCTKEMGAGQFSIFGATEDKARHGSALIFTNQEEALKADGRCVIVRVSAALREFSGNLVEWAAVISTESAQEMQKGRSQWSVVRDQGSVSIQVLLIRS